jgi:MtN3 and saliva related transmembrane protein
MIVTWIKYFIEIMFGLGVFFNAILFIPQAIKLFYNKNSKDVSLFTFAGFNVMQIFTVLHGYLNKDYVLMWGFLLSFILCGIVTVMIVIYRR